ncbi:MAG: DUF1501 domain-containing protein [Bacteroidota bacterium]
MTYTRRKFMGTLSCAALGSTTMLSSLLNLKAANALVSPTYKMASPQNDYKALVCLLLSGGNDSYNMIVPTENTQYNTYKDIRSNQALNTSDLHRINPLSGGEFGFHPSMGDVASLFNQGEVAVIANVGTLIEPVTRKLDFVKDINKLPLGLFSHADQIQQWQTSVPQDRSALGWAGKMADMLRSSNTNTDISMNISLSGNNVFQAGNITTEYTITPYGQGSVGIAGYENASDSFSQIRAQAVKSLLEQQYQDVFKQSYADVIKTSQASHQLFSTAVSSVSLNTIFSPNPVSQSMAMIAKTIASRSTLGMNRQVFFVDFPGWDHHDELLNNQAEMLKVVNDAMKEFNDAMKELGVHDDVTSFMISDFARTLNSNGNGTDHAWGGNVLVMGGSVKGNTFYGNYPNMITDTILDFGGGIVIPKVSTDEYFAELALWYGVSPSDLSLVLPNINKFYDTSSSTAPLGFLM